MRKLILVHGEITSSSGIEVVKRILETVNNDEITEIVFLISSGGGSICAFVPIREALKMANKKVTSIGMQFVCSTATAIFMLGERRILFPDTQFLIHNASINFSKGDRLGPYKFKQIDKENTEANRQLHESVLMNSTITPRLLKSKISNDGDWDLTPKEVKKYNIITEDYNMEEVKKLLTEDIWRDKNK